MDALDDAIFDRLTGSAALMALTADFAGTKAVFTTTPIPPGVRPPFIVVPETFFDVPGPFDTKNSRGRSWIRDIGCYTRANGDSSTVERMAALVLDLFQRKSKFLGVIVENGRTYAMMVSSATGPVVAPTDDTIYGRIVTVAMSAASGVPYVQAMLSKLPWAYWRLNENGVTIDYAFLVNGKAPWGYWRVGESVGATAEDSSGNNRDAQYVGEYTFLHAGLVAGDPDHAVAMIPSLNPPSDVINLWVFDAPVPETRISDFGVPDVSVGDFTIALWFKKEAIRYVMPFGSWPVGGGMVVFPQPLTAGDEVMLEQPNAPPPWVVEYDPAYLEYIGTSPIEDPVNEGGWLFRVLLVPDQPTGPTVFSVRGNGGLGNLFEATMDISGFDVLFAAGDFTTSATPLEPAGLVGIQLRRHTDGRLGFFTGELIQDPDGAEGETIQVWSGFYSATILQPDAVHQLLAYRTGDGGRAIYVDGVFDGSPEDTPLAWVAPTTDWMFGGLRRDGDARSAYGVLDELIILTRVLGTFTDQPDITTPGPIALDSSGNNRHGIFRGGATGHGAWVYGVPGLLIDDPDPAVRIDPATVQSAVTRGRLIGFGNPDVSAGELTVSVWYSRKAVTWTTSPTVINYPFSRGDIINLTVPAGTGPWTVTFDPAIVEFIGPGTLEAPDPSGWHFRVAVGISSATSYNTSIQFAPAVGSPATASFFVFAQDTIFTAGQRFELKRYFDGRFWISTNELVPDPLGGPAVFTSIRLFGISVGEPGETYHLVAVRTAAGGVRLYVNGGLEASYDGAVGWSMLTKWAWGTIDQLSSNGQDTFGTLDEPAIWNRALSAEEVADLYQNGIG